MKKHKLRIGGESYDALRSHLFPGDGLEAVAFALCGHLSTSNEEIYTVHSIFLYPHNKCTVRAPDRVEWAPPEIAHLFEKCRNENFKLLKIHCHPEYWPFFSKVDDKSDLELSDTLTGWTDRDDNICSVIILPDGSLMGRTVDATGHFTPLTSILVISDNIRCYYDLDEKKKSESRKNDEEDIQLRTKQAFGEGTTNILRKLKIGIVGCSGTGSIVAELLGRLGVGSLVLVDHDKIEFKNVNRILNSTFQHANAGEYKVDVLKAAIKKMGTGVEVIAVADDLHSQKAYNEIAACDLVFGCMDTVDGRYLLNRIATYFCSGYFDIGIRLDADGQGGINEVLGRVDYLKPGGSSLFTRGRYNLDQLKAADMLRADPEEYAKQLKEGYVKSANVPSPAVISINMMFSSQAVTELLARLHPFRDNNNANYAAVTFSVSGFLLIAESDGPVDEELNKKIGLGHRKPALGSPSLIYPVKPK